MRIRLFPIALYLLWSISAVAQARQKPVKSPAQLELSVETATTDDDGLPTALLVMVKNIGGLSVDLPVLHSSCLPDGGVKIRMSWTSSDLNHKSGRGWGGACGETDRPSVMTRAKNEWVRLRPGEFMTTVESIRNQTLDLDAGTVEYWVVYDPPQASAKELVELQQAGYNIPVEKVETEHMTFAIQ